MLHQLHTLFHPEQYHGQGKTKRFFEGWYYKVVNADESRAFAIIPGIAMDENGMQQSFIQVLDGKKLTAEYHKYNVNEFSSEKNKFELRISSSFFSVNTIRLDLPEVKGELNFEMLVPWPCPWYSPGIMGPFSFVPFMECYHGILSMNHTIHGKLIIHGETIDFTDGRGYIEKDWGHSFPDAYFWMQTNHFSQDRISLKASVAKIPWLGSSFVGFIAGVWIHDRIIRFTTYNSTKLITSFADQKKVELVMENKNYRLEILALREAATYLASPISGFMDGRIEESMNSRIEVQLYDKINKKLLLNDTGKNAGLEVAGNIKEIFIQQKS
jgi:hypothetical protein